LYRTVFGNLLHCSRHINLDQWLFTAFEVVTAIWMINQDMFQRSWGLKVTEMPLQNLQLWRNAERRVFLYGSNADYRKQNGNRTPRDFVWFWTEATGNKMGTKKFLPELGEILTIWKYRDYYSNGIVIGAHTKLCWGTRIQYILLRGHLRCEEGLRGNIKTVASCNKLQMLFIRRWQGQVHAPKHTQGISLNISVTSDVSREQLQSK
jgi:hypothetical protein